MALIWMMKNNKLCNLNSIINNLRKEEGVLAKEKQRNKQDNKIMRIWIQMSFNKWFWLNSNKIINNNKLNKDQWKRKLVSQKQLVYHQSRRYWSLLLLEQLISNHSIRIEVSVRKRKREVPRKINLLNNNSCNSNNINNN